MKIRITVEGTPLTATLDDNESARAFAALLPLALTLDDYAATEKISDLPARLPTTGAPPGTAPSAGDIAYYAPWGNLALFYRSDRHAQGLVRLGRLHAWVEAIATPSSLRVMIEAVA